MQVRYTLTAFLGMLYFLAAHTTNSCMSLLKKPDITNSCKGGGGIGDKTAFWQKTDIYG